MLYYRVVHCVSQCSLQKTTTQITLLCTVGKAKHHFLIVLYQHVRYVCAYFLRIITVVIIFGIPSMQCLDLYKLNHNKETKLSIKIFYFFNGSNLMFSSSFLSKVLLEFSQLIKFFLDFDEQENVTWTLWSPRRESKPKNISKKKFVAHLLSAPHEFLGQQLMVNFAFALNNPEIFRCRTSKQSVLCDLKVQFRCLELRILFVWRIPLEKSRQKQEGFLPGYKKTPKWVMKLRW